MQESLLRIKKTVKFYKCVYEFPFWKMELTRMMKEHRKKELSIYAALCGKGGFYECNRIWKTVL